MKYNFDKVIDRRNTDSRKWTMLEEFFGRNDLLPLWVADMDFKAPDEVIEAFIERSKHGVFGYTYRLDSFYDSIVSWTKRRYNWDIKKEWIVYTPGVVMGLNLGVLELTEPGDKVIIQTPVYPPFGEVVTKNNRQIINNELIYSDGKFVMDLEDLERKIDKDTKLMMICNPHNPVGRVWSEEELLELGKICLKHDIPIVSDEIHADFILKGHKHKNIGNLSKELEENTVTLLAPSKTFNIAGLNTSIAIIPNEKIRQKYIDAIERIGIDSMNIFGALGLEVAYNHGEEWLEEVLVYLEDNIDFAIDYINKNIPKIKVTRPEGTYLLWLNFEDVDRDADKVKDALINVGKVALNDGRPYGENGYNFFRLNIGCSRTILEEGLDRIRLSVDSL